VKNVSVIALVPITGGPSPHAFALGDRSQFTALFIGSRVKRSHVVISRGKPEWVTWGMRTTVGHPMPLGPAKAGGSDEVEWEAKSRRNLLHRHDPAFIEVFPSNLTPRSYQSLEKIPPLGCARQTSLLVPEAQPLF